MSFTRLGRFAAVTQQMSVFAEAATLKVARALGEWGRQRRDSMPSPTPGEFADMEWVCTNDTDAHFHLEPEEACELCEA